MSARSSPKFASSVNGGWRRSKPSPAWTLKRWGGLARPRRRPACPLQRQQPCRPPQQHRPNPWRIIMASNLWKNVYAVSRVALARMRFLAVFLVAALLVGYWGTIQNCVNKWTRPPVAPDSLAQTSAIEYYCVMHPTVIRSEPGNCPICGMPLAKRKKGEKVELPGGVVARVQLTPQRIALAGV